MSKITREDALRALGIPDPKVTGAAGGAAGKGKAKRRSKEHYRLAGAAGGAAGQGRKKPRSET